MSRNFSFFFRIQIKTLGLLTVGRPVNRNFLLRWSNFSSLMCFLELYRKLLWVIRLGFDSRESLCGHLVGIVIIFIVMLCWHVGMQMRFLCKSLLLEELRRVKTSKWMRRTLCSSWNTGYWQVGHNWLRKIEALVTVVLSVNIVAVVILTLNFILGKSMSLGDNWFLPDFL